MGEGFFEGIFGKEHHEARATRFMDKVRQAAKSFPELETVVSNMTEEDLDLGPETELAARLDGNEDLAKFIRDDNAQAEADSASETVVAVTTSGDDAKRIQQAIYI